MISFLYGSVAPDLSFSPPSSPAAAGAAAGVAATSDGDVPFIKGPLRLPIKNHLHLAVEARRQSPCHDATVIATAARIAGASAAGPDALEVSRRVVAPRLLGRRSLAGSECSGAQLSVRATAASSARQCRSILSAERDDRLERGALPR